MIKFKQKHYINIVNESLNTVKMANVGLLQTIFYIVSIVMGLNTPTQGYSLLFGILGFIESVNRWVSEMLIESRLLGKYTRKVTKSLMVGSFLFVASESFLFASFVWPLFDRFSNQIIFSKTTFYENPFPLVKVTPVDSWYKCLPIIPSEFLIGTLLLLVSSLTFNVYKAFYDGFILNEEMVLTGEFTQFFGFSFILLQLLEYGGIMISISNGAVPSSFFMLTGFHGLHVLIGVVIMILQQSLVSLELKSTANVGLFYSLIYWHFVDGVWIIVVILAYLLIGSPVFLTFG